MQREQLEDAGFFYPVSQAKTHTLSVIIPAISWAASTALWAAGEGGNSAPLLCFAETLPAQGVPAQEGHRPWREPRGGHQDDPGEWSTSATRKG